MRKTLTKSFFAVIVALLLCLGVGAALLSDTNVAQAAATVNDEWRQAYEGNYYDNLNENLSGATFRSQLASLITSTHHTYTVYNGSSDLALNNVWPTTDIDPNTGKMLWFYTGTPRDGFSGTSNREHVWPKDGGKAFTAEARPGADAHHLRPTDSQLNSTRGSLSFGVVTGGKEALENKNPSGCYYDSSFFYPRAGYRGQTARILMYMQTRWGNEFNLKFVLGKGNSKTIGDIATLFKWHLQEPPTEAEIYRNNAVASIQGNRNPFIDHPEYAAKIYCYDGESYNSSLLNVLNEVGDSYDNSNAEPLTSLTFKQSSAELTVGQQLTLSVTKTPSSAKVSLTWASSDTTVATVSGTGVVKAVKQGVATVTVTDRDTRISAAITVTVQAASVTPDPDPTPGPGTDPDPGPGPTPPPTTPSTPQEVLDEFTSAMEDVADSATPVEQRNSIKSALQWYQQLTDEQKRDASVAAQYEKLLEAIDEYNESVTSQNTEMQQALKTAFSAFFGTTATAAVAVAALTIVRRKYF